MRTSNDKNNADTRKTSAGTTDHEQASGAHFEVLAIPRSVKGCGVRYTSAGAPPLFPLPSWPCSRGHPDNGVYRSMAPPLHCPIIHQENGITSSGTEHQLNDMARTIRPCPCAQPLERMPTAGGVYVSVGDAAEAWRHITQPSWNARCTSHPSWRWLSTAQSNSHPRGIHSGKSSLPVKKRRLAATGRALGRLRALATGAGTALGPWDTMAHRARAQTAALGQEAANRTSALSQHRSPQRQKASTLRSTRSRCFSFFFDLQRNPFPANTFYVLRIATTYVRMYTKIT